MSVHLIILTVFITFQPIYRKFDQVISSSVKRLLAHHIDCITNLSLTAHIQFIRYSIIYKTFRAFDL